MYTTTAIDPPPFAVAVNARMAAAGRMPDYYDTERIIAALYDHADGLGMEAVRGNEFAAVVDAFPRTPQWQPCSPGLRGRYAAIRSAVPIGEAPWRGHRLVFGTRTTSRGRPHPSLWLALRGEVGGVPVAAYAPGQSSARAMLLELGADSEGWVADRPAWCPHDWWDRARAVAAAANDPSNRGWLARHGYPA